MRAWPNRMDFRLSRRGVVHPSFFGESFIGPIALYRVGQSATRSSPPPSRTPIRCAIYTRQSVSSNDGFSSCEVQYDLCRAFVESQHTLGWALVDERFDDDGVSGATLNRQALRHLLARIRDRQVDQVVVHRLDRLARSLIGCVSLVEEFTKHDARLVIVTAPELGCAAQDNLVFNIRILRAV